MSDEGLFRRELELRMKRRQRLKDQKWRYGHFPTGVKLGESLKNRRLDEFGDFTGCVDDA